MSTIFKNPKQSQEGAAMLIVMLILLMSTATATFAIQSTGLEVRSAGHERQALQTYYVTEAGIEAALAWVDDVSPAVVSHVMASSTPPDISSNEPNLLAGKQGYRLVLGDFQTLDESQDPNGNTVRNPPLNAIGEDASLGKVPYTPSFTIDINDNYTFTGALPGFRVDGKSAMKYMVATYTVRGQTSIPQSSEADPNVTAMDAVSIGRVSALSGPIGK